LAESSIKKGYPPLLKKIPVLIISFLCRPKPARKDPAGKTAKDKGGGKRKKGKRKKEKKKDRATRHRPRNFSLPKTRSSRFFFFALLPVHSHDQRLFSL
jgi:hypothetical protein